MADGRLDDGSINALLSENMRQIAVTGPTRLMGFSSCTAQKISLILMQCSIILVMFAMDSPAGEQSKA
ncbi:hypothetical protein [Taklimakanibacter lacteus]|uniref:hypothetical protein n=1 Tax=Taklimakanibacter lacteus TaxID=2268456 RepID=UPI0013C52E2E